MYHEVKASPSSSDSGSESLPDRSGFVQSRFRKFACPLCFSLIFEAFVVWAVWKWQVDSWSTLASIPLRDVTSFWGDALPGRLFLIVFVACLLGRLVTIAGWKWTSCWHDSQYAAVFAGFNCFPWIIYIALYFWLIQNFTVRKAHGEASQMLGQLPYGMVPPEYRPSCPEDPTWRDLDGSSCADYAEAIRSGHDGPFCEAAGQAAKTHCPVTCQSCTLMTGFFQCMQKQHRNFSECTTNMHVAGFVTCTKAFDPKTCAGFVSLPVLQQNGSMVDVRCCMDLKWERQLPSTALWQSPIKAFNFGIDDVLQFSLWVAVLVMTWSLQESPFLPPSPASKRFMNGVWLDILDVFMFSKHLNNDDIRDRALGISASGKAVEEQPLLGRLIWYTWLVAAACSCLSPVIYTWFRYREMKAVASQPVQDLDSVASAVVERLRCLDREGAAKLFDEGLEMVQREIQEHDQQPTRVAVLDKAGDATPLRSLRLAELQGRARYGHAWREEKKASYFVEYDDGDEEVVDLPRLEPVEEQPIAVQAERCSGWCHPSYLFPKGRGVATERRAGLLDAYRSFFTQELPFLLWRLWINWGDTSGIAIHLPMVKNMLFGLGDLLLILACGNEDATIMGFSPAALIHRFVAGQITGAVNKSGPGALMSMASGYAFRAASWPERRLRLKQSFLKQEQQMARAVDGAAVAAQFDEELGLVEHRLDKMQEHLKYMHT